ncbi:site-specific integrase [Natrinema hispanicum]|uniref:Site-specific recombinase XerD n=1 Tax=Natrinema hispanicum TaxID=392421 RepID=A0A1G6SLZ9_9EURY|nr:site-specific integrase [Natrinema hispanicum]SDD17661.1 Site-specific recombinase XerD [Natrinema hispanicum]
MAVEEHVNQFAEAVMNGDNSSTVDRYKRAVRGWLEWLEEHDIGVWEADGDDLERHLNHLTADGYAKSYAKVRRSAVSRFYQECAPDNVANPSEGIDMKWSDLDGYKKEKALRDRDYYIDDSDFEDMLEHAPAPKSRNIVLLKVLRRCGLRRGELAELREQDLDKRAGIIKVYREKSGKIISIPVPDGLMLELARWRDIGRKTMGGYDPTADWLFPSEKKPKLTGSHINKVVKEAADGAGIQRNIYTDKAGRERKRITAHSLRFSAAKDLQDEGVGIDKIQTFLGHSKVSQTEHYLRGREQAMQNAVRGTFD